MANLLYNIVDTCLCFALSKERAPCFRTTRRRKPRYYVRDVNNSPSLPRPSILPTVTMPKYTYNHKCTPNSPDIFLKLPTEIFDAVLSYLPSSDVQSVSLAHRVFRFSVESVFFHEIVLCDFRAANGKAYQVEKLVAIFEADPRLKEYVRKVTVGSVMDPTVRERVAELLPKALGLMEPKVVTLRFRELEHVTRGTQEVCLDMLAKIFENASIPSLKIETDHPSLLLTQKLSSLNLTAYSLTGSHRSQYFQGRNLLGKDWLDSLPVSTLRHLNLGDALISPARIKTIFETMPNITALYVTVDRHALATDIMDAISLKKSTLQELGLRRPPLCTRAKEVDEPAYYFNDWPALWKLNIEASFLFGSVQCSPHNGGNFSYRQFTGENPNRLYLQSWINHDLPARLPPRLRDLRIEFIFPQAIFHADPPSRDASSESEFAWMLHLAQRHPRLRQLELVEQTHECSGADPFPRVGLGSSYLYEFDVAPEVRRALRAHGIEVGVWLRETDPDVLRVYWGMDD
ncbi:hypothetical protein IQ07DRAFT_684926 [Pyrenochaeta sp. DS3sAY3a]|nr:hypothetical protein IQ07DRAFT_684926 [Pyrenochaeta sp. DS3sAY3a]